MFLSSPSLGAPPESSREGTWHNKPQPIELPHEGRNATGFRPMAGMGGYRTIPARYSDNAFAPKAAIRPDCNPRSERRFVDTDREAWP
jgi:hypothetical protein